MSDQKFLEVNEGRIAKMVHALENTVPASIRSNKPSDDAIAELLGPLDEALASLWPAETGQSPATGQEDDEPVGEDEPAYTPGERQARAEMPSNPLAASHFIHSLDDACFMAAVAACMSRLADAGFELKDQLTEENTDD